MALIVEDGNIVTGANTYVSEAGFATYLADRGLTLSGDNGTAEQVIIIGMDYIETRQYQGMKSTKEQGTQWPRIGVVVDGYDIDSDEIPSDLIIAQYEVAFATDAGNNPLSNLDRETKMEKVGDIQVEYSDSAKDSVELRKVDARLDKLLMGGGSSGVTFLARA